LPEAAAHPLASLAGGGIDGIDLARRDQFGGYARDKVSYLRILDQHGRLSSTTEFCTFRKPFKPDELIWRVRSTSAES
jgi:hypothetical protein